MLSAAWLKTWGVLGFAALSRADERASTWDMRAYNWGSYGYNPNQTFRSSNVVAPMFGINLLEPEALGNTSLPFLFLTGKEPDKNASASPFIFNATDFSLVWADNTNSSRGEADNFKPQFYRNETSLVFWETRRFGNQTNATCVLYDDQYQQRHTLTTSFIGAQPDFHDCTLTRDGTALLTASKWIRYDLRSVRGKESDRLLNNYFQEVDIDTGNVLFSWSAIEHFRPEDSFFLYHNGFDFFHLNSVQKDQDGDYLISARNFHMVALIGGAHSHKPGSPIWILGGVHNQFRDISKGHANFRWQHDARLGPESRGDGPRLTTELTLFDNHAFNLVPGHTGYLKEYCSSAKRLILDLKDMTVRLDAAYLHPENVQSSLFGSFQQLSTEGVPNGNLVVGWGTNPSVTEYTADGRCVMDVQFGPFRPAHKPLNTVMSYRAFKGNWVGKPTTDPSISTDYAESMVYVSWNGATEVRSWAVLVGDEHADDLKHLVTVQKRGFETEISVPRHIWVQIQALDAEGQVLGSTKPWNYRRNQEADNYLRRKLEAG